MIRNLDGNSSQDFTAFHDDSFCLEQEIPVAFLLLTHILYPDVERLLQCIFLLLFMLLYVFYTFLRRVSRLLTYDAQRYVATRTSVDCVCSALPEGVPPQRMTLSWTDSTMPYYRNSKLSASELSGRSNIPRHPKCRRGPKGILQPQAEARISPLRQCTHQAQAAILRRTLLQKIAAVDIAPNLLGDTVLDPLDTVPDLQLTFVMTKLMLLCLTPTTTINLKVPGFGEKKAVVCSSKDL
ncbi:hypothetical protein EV421DRAFT_1815852 [Armillaria borealis]|uniref:Uncharacterized protein n=1 Tax=Armillaria borealis TaxID=47425 RepID=A0AA39JEN7_9AGAR|nr:hypothetical protein EV421DRAFT_1815852 [Armillaria borealis]